MIPPHGVQNLLGETLVACQLPRKRPTFHVIGWSHSHLIATLQEHQTRKRISLANEEPRTRYKGLRTTLNHGETNSRSKCNHEASTLNSRDPSPFQVKNSI